MPTVLAHYGQELRETLGRIGVTSTSVVPNVAIDDKDAPRASRLLSYAGVVRNARRTPEPVVVTWPTLGYLEPVAWLRSRKDRISFIVAHDPVAIRDQYGHGGLSRRLAGELASGNWGSQLVCHTPAAAEAARALLGMAQAPPVALHPVVSSVPIDRQSDGVSVVVAGEYKPSRDIDLLVRLGPLLAKAGLQGRVFGRGWPDIEGWTVDPRFVAEAELDYHIASAIAVLVPYTRYWQSGIAVRALEIGTPVIGETHPFLNLLFGETYPGLVHDASNPRSWMAAIHATADAADQVHSAARAYRTAADKSWEQLLATRGAEWRGNRRSVAR